MLWPSKEVTTEGDLSPKLIDLVNRGIQLQPTHKIYDVYIDLNIYYITIVIIQIKAVLFDHWSK